MSKVLSVRAFLDTDPKTAFFQWRHNYVIITYCRASIDRPFYNFSVTGIVRMIRAKNCGKLSKVVKVTAKILSVPFFRTQCICIDTRDMSSVGLMVGHADVSWRNGWPDWVAAWYKGWPRSVAHCARRSLNPTNGLAVTFVTLVTLILFWLIDWMVR